MNSIYLDHNSTTPIDPEVARIIANCYAEGFVNPASAHRLGQMARKRLEKLRFEIVEMLGGETRGRDLDQLVFTSGGTESNNLAIAGLAPSLPGRIAISSIEHPSVFGSARNLARQGFQIEQICVDQNGVCNLDHLHQILNDDASPIRLVSVMLANNETGVIQPVREVARIAHDKGAFVHCDAVQGVAKIRVNFRDLDVDTMSFTAHKFHGPRGIGGLLIRSHIHIHPILFGGFQQNGVRPGTEDVALVAGLHRALQLFDEQTDERIKRLTELKDRLERKIVDTLPDTVINGVQAMRVPHTSNLSFPGLNRQEFLMAADMHDLAISTGSACASGSSDPSHVLVAMKAPSAVIEGSIRVSLGTTTTTAEIDEASGRIISIANMLRRSK